MKLFAKKKHKKPRPQKRKAAASPSSPAATGGAAADDSGSTGGSVKVRRQSPASAAAAGAPAQADGTASAERTQDQHDAFLAEVKAQCASSTFRTLQLRPWIVKNCASLAIERPTPVQLVCIPKVLGGRDVIAGSPTGSGKTAAFALPLMHKLSADPYGIFTVVLTPTRELAIQIAEQFTALGAPIRLKVCTVIGGCSLLEQQNELAARPHVVVATPGRFMQHVVGPVPPRLNQLHAMVLDEADRLLDSDDFGQQVETVMRAVPVTCQLLLFSATLSPELSASFAKLRALCGGARRQRQLTAGGARGGGGGGASAVGRPAKPARAPFKFDFSGGMRAVAVTARTLRQRHVLQSQSMYLFVPQHMKLVNLVWLLLTFGPIRVPADPDAAGRGGTTRREEAPEMTWAGARNAIVFVRHKHEADQMLELAREFEIPSVCLHAGLSQRRRQAALAKFKAGQMRLLFATDVASRGLDIPKVQLVINYDIPATPSDYVHRVGRTARAGRDGVAISLMSQYDVARLHAIEEYIGLKLQALEGTEGDEVAVPEDADADERASAVARHARRKREIEDEVLALMNKTAKAWSVAELRVKARAAEAED